MGELTGGVDKAGDPAPAAAASATGRHTVQGGAAERHTGTDEAGVSGGAAGDLPEFAEAVLDLVDAIPAGRVLAYGDVAEMVGRGGARGVGNVMSRYGGLTTWWRVVRVSGDPAPGLQDRALAHWREEDTPLVGGQAAGRRVDMRRGRWQPS